MTLMDEAVIFYSIFFPFIQLIILHTNDDINEHTSTGIRASNQRHCWRIDSLFFFRSYFFLVWFLCMLSTFQTLDFPDIFDCYSFCFVAINFRGTRKQKLVFLEKMYYLIAMNESKLAFFSSGIISVNF